MPDHSHLELIRLKLQQQGYVEIPSVGYSMYPVIRTGDLCKFVPIKRSRLTPGRIVLFADTEGRLIGHRLLRVENRSGAPRFICKGDTNLYPDDPVGMWQMLGELVLIMRRKSNGKVKTIPVNTLKGAIWGIVVRRLKGLSYVLRRIAAMDSASRVQLAQKQ